MQKSKSVLLLALGSLSTVGFADVYSYALTPGLITDDPAANALVVNTTGASGAIRGYTITGDWTAVGGGPFSGELTSRIAGLSDVGGGSLDRYVGGDGNGAAFTFNHAYPTWNGASPTTWSDAEALVGLTAGNLGGSFTVNLYQELTGSSANLTNASVNFFTDAIAPVNITTTGQSTMTGRPNSFTGTAAGSFRYVATTFTPQVTGTFIIGLHTAGTDGYLLGYQGAFNPSSPLTNIIGRDDVGDLGDSESSNFVLGLTAGQQYTFVSTTFSDTDDITNGTLVIAGPTAPVPEPASMAALGLGIAGLVAKRRRK